MSTISWHHLPQETPTRAAPPPAFIRFVWAISPGASSSPLTRTHEARLVHRVQIHDDQAALARLSAAHERMLAKMSHKIARQNDMKHMIDDFQQTAFTAFAEAVKRFRTNEDARLSTYARYRVAGALLRFALDFRHALSIGRSSDERKAYYQKRAAIDAFVQNHGRKPNGSANDIGDLAGRLGVSSSAMSRGLEAGQMSTLSLHQIEAWDTTAPDCPDVDRDKVAEILERAIRRTLAPLKDRDRAIVEAFLGDPEAFDGPALASKHDVTPERIGQIRRSALSRIRDFLAADGFDYADLASAR